MSACIAGKTHEFIDVYDSSEELPDDVISIADNFSSADSVEQTLQAGKLVSHAYVLSYCKHCGMKVERT